MIPVTTSLGSPTTVCSKSQIVHWAETAMLFLDISGCQIDVLARHFQRRVTKDSLQAEGISAIYQVPYAESMPAGVGMQIRHVGKFLYPLKHFLDRSMSDGNSVYCQINAILVLWICRIGTLLGKIIEQGFLRLKTEGHFALLAALSENCHFADRKIDLGQRQIHQLVEPDAGIQKKHHYREIAQPFAGAIQRYRKDSLDFFFAQRLRECFGEFRQFQPSHHIIIQVAFLIRPGRERANSPSTTVDILDLEFSFFSLMHGVVLVARFPLHETSNISPAIFYRQVMESEIFSIGFSDEIVEEPEPRI